MSHFPMSILVTGGTGYIGSHICSVLIERGYQVSILDNLSNSNIRVLDRLANICSVRPQFIQGDIQDGKLLKEIFASQKYVAVIHLAGLKAVGESVSEPLKYYNTNIKGSITLFSAMQTAGVRRLVFSSSATVYGDPARCPIDEHFPRVAKNPYARSKLIIEDIMSDLKAADPNWRMISLRYFNPIGAHPSGQIGEAPVGIPNNLVPYLTQVAAGKLSQLTVFGNDYPTPDGTGVRDYFHVMDLAEGHIAALLALDNELLDIPAVNLGTGFGYSVLEVIGAFERAVGRCIPYEIVARRAGDVSECWADPTYAKSVLKWQAKYDLDTMCEDHWRWQYNNPDGYQ